MPIPTEGKYPVVQYADDTIVILPAEPDQLHIFKELLDLFASITGLKVNYHKSSMIPTNLSSDEASSLANILGCQIAAMPFTYLGLPMGTTRPTMKDFAPLIDRVERSYLLLPLFYLMGTVWCWSTLCYNHSPLIICALW